MTRVLFRLDYSAITCEDIIECHLLVIVVNDVIVLVVHREVIVLQDVEAFRIGFVLIIHAVLVLVVVFWNCLSFCLFLCLDGFLLIELFLLFLESQQLLELPGWRNSWL